MARWLLLALVAAVLVAGVLSMTLLTRSGSPGIPTPASTPVGAGATESPALTPRTAAPPSQPAAPPAAAPATDTTQAGAPRSAPLSPTGAFKTNEKSAPAR